MLDRVFTLCTKEGQSSRKTQQNNQITFSSKRKHMVIIWSIIKLTC